MGFSLITSPFFISLVEHTLNVRKAMQKTETWQHSSQCEKFNLNYACLDLMKACKIRWKTVQKNLFFKQIIIVLHTGDGIKYFARRFVDDSEGI